MYRVLLADDEPIILSGIKFLIDWEKNNCQIVGTARNGQQALEKIEALQPDIVICDIAMPAMSGIELLERVAGRAPEIVFIMLTNHPDFQLARDALRFRAFDYLLKSQLEPAALEQSLVRACAERDKRTKLARAELTDEYTVRDTRALLRSAFLHILQAQPGAALEKSINILRENNVLEQYAAAYLPLDFSDAQDGDNANERRRLSAWVREMAENLAESVFPQVLLLSLAETDDSFILLCWQLQPERWRERLDSFAQKLSSAAATVTRVRAYALATDCFSGKEALEECRSQLLRLRDAYYLQENDAAAPAVGGSLGLTGIGERLTAELRERSAAGCRALFDRAIARVSSTPHQRSQALWLCGEICGAVSTVRETTELPDCCDVRTLDLLGTRTQVISWLERVRNELCAALEQSAAGRSEFAERARQYVLDNVDKRIFLQSVADAVSISPGYLSALFKKTYGMNLVDFINKVKCERACELIKEGSYRIYEISYRLGFENAYYFTRVFKRNIGLTPTAYQKQLRGGNEHVE